MLHESSLLAEWGLFVIRLSLKIVPVQWEKPPFSFSWKLRLGGFAEIIDNYDCSFLVVSWNLNQYSQVCITLNVLYAASKINPGSEKLLGLFNISWYQARITKKYLKCRMFWAENNCFQYNDWIRPQNLRWSYSSHPHSKGNGAWNPIFQSVVDESRLVLISITWSKNIPSRKPAMSCQRGCCELLSYHDDPWQHCCLVCKICDVMISGNSYRKES